MKKTVVFLSMCCMMVAAVFGVGAMRDGAAPAVARAETVMPAETENVTTVASGTWGSLSWTLDSEGRFTISGSGSMWSFSSSSTSAWLAYKTSIKSVVVDVGVTSIGEYAFSGCSSLTSVKFKNPNGWKYHTNNSSWETISSRSLSDASTAATYLTNKYYDYDWKRS